MAMLFLISSKTLLQTPIEEWLEVFREGDVIFTDQFQAWETEKSFINQLPCQIYHFEQYQKNGLVEHMAKKLHRHLCFEKIITTSESDILRCAKLREELDIEGPSLKDALLFRDKYLMKSFLEIHDVKIPQYCKVRYATDLINFFDKYGDAVVLKPNLGAGSKNTYIIKDEIDLEKILSQGIIDSAYGTPDFIVETFVDGPMFHVDGFVQGGRIIINQPSAYFNTCIEFKKGVHVGSYLLDNHNPLTERLKKANRNILAVMPNAQQFTFHTEFFLNNENEIIFCEIACRPGGGGIKDNLQRKYGINIIIEWMKSERDATYLTPLPCQVNDISGGFILVPPTENELQRMPNLTPFDWVTQYKISANSNIANAAEVRTSGEMFNIHVEGENESECLDRLNRVSAWVGQYTMGAL